jgi:polar amino acid transport system substrate-binding protein
MALALAWGCRPPDPGAAAGGQSRRSTVETVLRRGKLRVGFSQFRRWAMLDKEGQYIGFEIDVARRLAEDMGVELELVPTKWEGIIAGLQSGEFDVIIGGMAITPQRNKKVNFSIAYDYSGMGIVAHKEKAAGFDSLEDFNQEGVIIVCREGSTAEQAVRKHFPRAELRTLPKEEHVRQELLSGNVHAQVASVPEPRDSARKYPDKLFQPTDEQFTREPVGFAVQKGDVDTLNYFNNWIRVRRSGGWFEERKEYWFATEDWLDQVE